MKIQWWQLKLVFSRTTGPTLSTAHSWVKRIRVCSNGVPRPLTGTVKIYWRLLTTFSSLVESSQVILKKLLKKGGPWATSLTCETSGAMLLFYISVIWYGMVFVYYGMLFFAMLWDIQKWYDMVYYRMVWFGMVCYEILVNVPSFTEEFHLFSIYRFFSIKTRFLQFYTLNICVLLDNNLNSLIWLYSRNFVVAFCKIFGNNF